MHFNKMLTSVQRSCMFIDQLMLPDDAVVTAQFIVQITSASTFVHSLEPKENYRTKSIHSVFFI